MIHDQCITCVSFIAKANIIAQAKFMAQIKVIAEIKIMALVFAHDTKTKWRQLISLPPFCIGAIAGANSPYAKKA